MNCWRERNCYIVVVNRFSKQKVDYSGLQDHSFNLTADQELFFITAQAHVRLTCCCNQARLFGSQNTGLKVNQSIIFSCIIQMLFTAFVFCSLGLVKHKTEGQTI